MTVLEFLSDRLGRLVLWGSCTVLAAGILLATGTSPGVLILLLAALFLVFLAAQAQAFRRMRRTIETWERLLEGLDQKYLFPECAPKPQRLYERKLLDITRRSGQAMIGAVSEAQAAQRDYREYVERWVHEIKTPITAARLMARRSGADTRRKLEAELDQIGAHVERALFYARAENPEKDVLIHPASLSDLVNQAVQAHRALLLQNGVSVELCDLDFVVYTDRKWVCFLLGQLLQNAARYRRARPVIILSARRQEKRVELTVSDNGMGIPAHELPRAVPRGWGCIWPRNWRMPWRFPWRFGRRRGWAPRCCSPFPPRKSLQNCKIRWGNRDTTGAAFAVCWGYQQRRRVSCCKYRTLRNTMAARTK